MNLQWLDNIYLLMKLTYGQGYTYIISKGDQNGRGAGYFGLSKIPLV